MKMPFRIPLFVLVIGALCACSGQSTVSDREGDSDSGPTVYGKVSVSIDHVDTK